MLNIRRDQMHVLERAAQEDFAVRVAAFLRDAVPDRCGATSDAELLAFVARGIERALLHGFASERDACRYVLLATVLGADFDSEPALAEWVRPLLEASSERHASFRMDELFECAVEAVARSEAAVAASGGTRA